MFWIFILCFVVLMALALFIFLMPQESSKAAKKKEKKEKKPALMPDPAVAAKQKDWEEIARRWERQNNALLGDVERLKEEQKKFHQDMDQQKLQQKDLMEKLTLEKSWREKEQTNVDKSKALEKDVKDQLLRTEGDLEKSHSQRLRIEREFQELKIKHDEILEEKRQLAVKAGSLETTLTQANKDLRALKNENVQLSKKREDIQWVAKSEHDDLKKKMADAESELARLREHNA